MRSHCSIKKFSIITALTMGIVLRLSSPSYSGIIIDSSGTPFVPVEGVLQYQSEIENIFNTTGPAFATAILLANIGGYPVGTSSLGGPGHFFVGLSLNVGMANMKFFDDDLDRPRGYYPGFGPNPAIFAGIGLDDRLDLFLKFFMYNDSIYRPPVDFSYASLTGINLYSAGAKFRYRTVDRVIIFPGLFHFGGIVLSLGADVMSGTLSFDGKYPYDLGTILVDTGGSGIQPAPVVLNSIYSAKMRWYMASVTLEGLVFFDIFWIFSVYTGAGITLGYGTFEMKALAYGIGVTTNTDYITNRGTDQIGYISATADTLYRPKLYHPLFIIGFDINLFITRISVESVVDMRNRSDINLQLGARFQY